jgi:autotransporter translocation and assembly factor TamB
VSVTLPPQAAASVRARSTAVARALADSSGNLLLDLRVSGPVSAPRVEWDLRATQDRLIGRLSKTLLDQRRKIEEQVQAEAEARKKTVADSARIAVRQIQRATRDSLERRVKNVLEGFFKKQPPKSEPPKPEPPPAEAPPASARPDTTVKP